MDSETTKVYVRGDYGGGSGGFDWRREPFDGATVVTVPNMGGGAITNYLDEQGWSDCYPGQTPDEPDKTPDGRYRIERDATVNAVIVVKDGKVVEVESLFVSTQDSYWQFFADEQGNPTTGEDLDLVWPAGMPTAVHSGVEFDVEG